MSRAGIRCLTHRVWIRPVQWRETLDYRLKARGKPFVRDDNPMPAENKEYWRDVLDGCTTDLAELLKAKQLDLEDVTGVKKYLKRRPTCFDVQVEFKKQHPDKLILMKIGDFYETLGHDAIILIDKLGYTPMGFPHSDVPNAGAPVRSLYDNLGKLVRDEQLSVVVIDEYDLSPEERSRNQNREKGRRVAGIFNPGDEIILEEGKVIPTVVCLSAQADGFAYAEFEADGTTVKVTRGMTQDALLGKLNNLSIVAPVCIHRSFRDRMGDYRTYLRRVLPKASMRIQHLDSDDPLEGFVRFLKNSYLHLEETSVGVREVKSSRRCPSYYTAAQLGMTQGTGLPNIVEFIVPQREGMTVVEAWFMDLVQNPKPVETTKKIQTALRMIAESDHSFPMLELQLSPAAVRKRFDVAVPDVGFLRKLVGLCADVTSSFETEELKELSRIVLDIVMADQGDAIEIDADRLLWSCQRMKSELDQVLPY